MASYKNESNLTKAIKLSRLPRESMVNLLLNALTDCNYHNEVRTLIGLLNASSDYYLDQKADLMARNLTSKLKWDGEAVARVIANASKDRDILNALKRVGLYGGRLASSRKNKGFSAKKHYEEMMAKFRLPRLDRTRYTDLSYQGLEGPFIFKGGEVLYYDPKVGKYYDRDTDMYLSDRDADRITSAYRKASLKYAGKGLKSVQAILPGTSDRQANHFLHALAAEIVDGDVKYSRSKKIEGDIEVYRHSMLHPSSPSYPEPETFESTSGIASKMVIEVDLRKLEVASKMSLTNLSIQKGSKALKDLCDSLSKNIENNILKNMDEDELNIAFNYPMDEVSHELYSLEYSYEVKSLETIEYDYVITDIKIKNDTLRVHVSTRIEYDVLVTPPRYTEDGWL